MPKQTEYLLSEKQTHAAIKAATKRTTIVSLIVAIPISVAISLLFVFLAGSLALYQGDSQLGIVG